MCYKVLRNLLLSDFTHNHTPPAPGRARGRWHVKIGASRLDLSSRGSFDLLRLIRSPSRARIPVEKPVTLDPNHKSLLHAGPMISS